MSVGLFLPCFSNQAPNKHRRYGFSPPLPRWAALVCTQHNLHYVIFSDHSQEHSSGMPNLERTKSTLSASFKTNWVQRAICAAFFWPARLRCHISTRMRRQICTIAWHSWRTTLWLGWYIVSVRHIMQIMLWAYQSRLMRERGKAGAIFSAFIWNLICETRKKKTTPDKN